MTKRTYLAICAHPDDMEMKMGGVLWKLCRAGHKVGIVSLTNGNAGHHALRPAALAARRKREAGAVAAFCGLQYDILNIPDGRLEATVANRERLIRIVRRFNPEAVFTFRNCDYHPDHRATAQLVQDAVYLLGVPLICPDTPLPSQRPVVLLTHDAFRKPCPFSADIAVSIDDVLDEKAKMCACHASQYFEWLAFDRFVPGAIPGNGAARLVWLKKAWMIGNRRQAAEFRGLLKRRYASGAARVRNAEVFELSEYGRQPTAAELDQLLPR